MINAFAVPGGYLYITRGILAYLNSEAEFAGVIGHEIGHVTARHSASNTVSNSLPSSGWDWERYYRKSSANMPAWANFGVGMLFLKHGRDHERESDRLGVEYSTRAGYDARHMANFFKTLERMQPRPAAGIARLVFNPSQSDRAGAEYSKNVRAVAEQIGREFAEGEPK